MKLEARKTSRGELLQHIQHQSIFQDRHRPLTLIYHRSRFPIPPNPFSLSPPTDHLEQSKTFPDRDEIYKILSVHTPPILIGPVAVFLVDYFTCKNTTVTNLRVSTFKGLIPNHDADWLMLQWDEPELEHEVFAIFKVNIEAGLSSTLVHSGQGGRQPDGRRWATSSLSWWVLTMEDLKELLVAGQQVLEVMNWADPEMVEQFFDPNQTECSVQQCAPGPHYFLQANF